MLTVILVRLLNLYQILIVVECVLSWVPARGAIYDLHQAVRQLTEPFVDLFRQLIPALGGGGVRIDFSPMIAIIALDLAKRLVITLL